MPVDSALMRSVVLASADTVLRGRLRESLAGMRWKVREAVGGAEAMAQLEEFQSEALLVDSWLPDLEVGEFAGHVRDMFPAIDLLRVDGDLAAGGARSPRRNELLHALREAQEAMTPSIATLRSDSAAWAAAPAAIPLAAPARPLFREYGQWTAADGDGSAKHGTPGGSSEEDSAPSMEELAAAVESQLLPDLRPAAQPLEVAATANPALAIPDMIGASAPMLELARMVRLVAPRSTTVLIEGETGSGKEVVAKAIHKLSLRSQKPFTVLNCAAIPEALLEAELFGHTRGAFTGAVSSRTGRIEAAHAGTLFLDEIGEMPLPLQAKMLRFLECGELQRVGDNEVVRVDVRVIAATHQHLEQQAAEGRFRLDLYHRLAVFPLLVPALREHASDIAALAEFFLAELGREYPRKRLSIEAMRKLEQFDWPGNVRQLAHVLERGSILAGDSPTISAADIQLKSARA
jgi:DNA-binding NtrC family response regulator